MDEWIIVDEQAFECTRCGQRQEHHLPKVISHFNALAQEFIRLHQGCKRPSIVWKAGQCQSIKRE